MTQPHPLGNEFKTQHEYRPIEALRQAAPRAAKDSTRPVFHFLPPAQWMNDPNGPIYHNGYYHVFYQFNPFADSWGNIHWGHARSTDLVHWQHLPIALWPSTDKGEEGCYSGTCTIRRDGTPVILYTKAGAQGASQPFEQWMAWGNDQLLNWQKCEDNPVFSLDTYGGPPVHGNWRDPFIFECENRVYMVLGAVIDEPPEERAAVLLFRARDASLTSWEFMSELFSSPKYEREFMECPNFFPLGDKWVLCVSPYHPVEYYVGDFDTDRMQFKPSRKDRVDRSIDFYATNTFPAPDGRRIMVGWIRGFKKGLHWNGCLSLPREIELDGDNTLIQRPVRELEALRGTGYNISALTLQSEMYCIPGLEGKTLEIKARLSAVSAGRFGLRVRMGSGEGSGIEIALESDVLIVDGMKVHLPPEVNCRTVDLHLFLDNSVLELFVHEGRITFTRTIYPPEHHLAVGVFSDGKAVVEQLHAWHLDAAPVRGFPG